MSISPNTILQKGQNVRVGNMRGVVTESTMVNASNGGKIALTTVKLTEQFKRGFGIHGKWEKLSKPKVQSVNYSAIQLINFETFAE